MYSRSTGEVNSNRVTSSLLQKRTRLPTHAHEVGALTFEVTDNFGSNAVLPCGAYGPRLGHQEIDTEYKRSSVGRPLGEVDSMSTIQAQSEDVCKRDMKALDINTKFLGGPCSRLHEVEKHSEPTPQVRGREAGEHRSRKKGSAERSATTPTDQRPHTKAAFAAEIVSPTSVSAAPREAATIEQTVSVSVFSFSFSSRWHRSAGKGPYALRPVS